MPLKRLLRFGRAEARVPPGLRLYAIGDVHGRLDLLLDLLARIEADHRTRAGEIAAEVILLGDLIDRGPSSAEVVRAAMRGLPWAAMTVLLGNHEASMLDALDGKKGMLSQWLRMGGDATLVSWGVDWAIVDTAAPEDILAAADGAISPAERAWLARRPLHIRRGDYLFVHAGVQPGTALDAQKREDLLWIRDSFLASARDHGAVVVHGHAITREVDMRPNRIGIDTGAWRTGRLTALALEGDRRWQIVATKEPVTSPEDAIVDE